MWFRTDEKSDRALCSKLDNWGGGAHIHIFEFTDHESNRFQKKLIAQNMNIIL